MAKHASPSAHLQVVESPKSVAVQIPLPVLGALVDGKSALFDLCVSVGQQVLGVLMEHDRDTCCGPKGKQDPERKAVRAGSTRSEVTLGGRRIQVRRLRARGAAGELALPSFVFAADRDPLDRHTLEAIACGVSTRKYAARRTPNPDPSVETHPRHSTPASATSGGRLARFARPDCATQPVRTVPINPSSQKSARPRASLDSPAFGVTCVRRALRSDINRSTNFATATPRGNPEHAAGEVVAFVEAQGVKHSSDGLDGTVPGAQKAQIRALNCR